MEPSLDSSNNPHKSKACMLVLCGIPGSGKSTLATALAKAAEANGTTTVTLVDFDKQTGELLDEFDPEQWKKDRATSLEAVSQALNSLEIDHNNCSAATTTTSVATTAKKHHLVIVDDTMHYRSMRAECWRIARATGASYLYSHIKCPVETSLERNNSRPRGQRVPEEVLRKTAAMFEPPEENQHCPYDSDTYRVVLDTEGFLIQGENYASGNRKILDGEALWRFVAAAWGPPAPPPFDEEAEELRIAEARKSTSESLLHHVDVQTRKYLTDVLSSLPQQGTCGGGGRGGKDEKKKIAEDLNKQRRQVLDQVRVEVLANECDTDSVRASEIIEEFKNYSRDYLSSGHH